MLNNAIEEGSARHIEIVLELFEQRGIYIAPSLEHNSHMPLRVAISHLARSPELYKVVDCNYSPHI